MKKQLKIKNYKKVITRADTGEKVNLKKRQINFKHSISHKVGTNKKYLEKIFDKQVAPQVTKFFDDTHKNSKRQYIIKLKINKNVHGKRISGGFSIKRMKISKASLKEYLSKYKKAFMKSLEKYLRRKDMKSITFQGLEMEVISGKATKSRSIKRSNRKKKK